MGEFSGFPLTRWQGERNMILEEDFYFIDNNGKKWEVPKGGELNGATIPKKIWSIVGSPYVGLYRRASVVHDYYVGEGNNPDVSFKERRLADKMFFQACKTGGCSWDQAAMLYIGVSIGSWTSKALKKSRSLESMETSENDDMVEQKFQYLSEKCQYLIEKEENFDALEMLIDQEIQD